jgi:hypothetical protein
MTDEASKGVQVRASSIHERGLFALKTFEVGEVVLRWDLTHSIPNEEVSQLPVAERRYTHPLGNGKTLLVQAPERYVNHSCDNNTEVRDFCDVAVRRILSGEEITSDYTADGPSTFICSCGSPNCRGEIRTY